MFDSQKQSSWITHQNVTHVQYVISELRCYSKVIANRPSLHRGLTKTKVMQFSDGAESAEILVFPLPLVLQDERLFHYFSFFSLEILSSLLAFLFRLQSSRIPRLRAIALSPSLLQGDRCLRRESRLVALDDTAVASAFRKFRFYDFFSNLLSKMK